MTTLDELRTGYDLLRQGRFWHSTGRCKGWADLNPGEANALDAYINAILAGQTPDPPVLATVTGQAYVRWVSMAVGDIAPPPPPPPAGQTPFGISWPWGFHSLSDATQKQYLADEYAIGCRWVRYDLPWVIVQASGASSWDWTLFDRVLDNSLAAGMQVLFILDTSPQWARSSSEYWSPPTDPQTFARFAAAAAARYKGRVAAYEIWNEPNLTGFWHPAPDPAAYTKLLVAAYPAIKAADAAALVLSGGLSPAGSYNNSGSPATINPLNFFEGIYQNGGGDSFDAAGHHPYDSTGFSAQPWSAWYQMYGTTPSLRSIMAAHGQSKPIWGTEHGWNVGVWTYNGAPLTETQAAQWLEEGYTKWQAFTWPRGPLFHFTYRSASGDAGPFSIRDPATGTPRLRYDAYKSVAT